MAALNQTNLMIRLDDAEGGGNGAAADLEAEPLSAFGIP